MARTLPKEITSLIHHVALNEQGWWDKTIQRLIVSALWNADGNQLTKAEITTYCLAKCNVILNADKLNRQIDKLCSSKSLLKIDKETFKLCETEIVNFNADIKRYDEIESSARKYFEEIIKKHCNEEEQLKITWESFNSDLLIPVLYEFGAKTYELITGKGLPIETNVKFKKYLTQFPLERHTTIRDAIIAFLNPQNSDVRSLVLRKLNAYFFLEAANLSSDAVDQIAKVSKRQPTFKVFIDTNFLFSILGLHENPSNEAAQALIETIAKVSNKVKFKFYISPLTIEETRKVIIKEEQRLKNLRPTQLISKVASDYISNGFAKKYFEECSRAKKAIKAEDYFAPYMESMIVVLKSKGIDIYNDSKFEEYSTSQKVIDDIVQQQEWEQKKFPAYLQKSYEKLKHDFVLWHFVSDLRPAYVESADQASAFVVTIDFRFINFDAKKRKGSRRLQVPICVHPTNLIQILQLWVPRDVEFESAVLSNLRFPFLFTEFDADTEYTTIRIIEQISRYENIDDLPEDTLRAVLFNKALRSKIDEPENRNKEASLVKEAIIEENKKANQLVEITSQRAKILDRHLQEKHKELEYLSGTLQSEKSEKQVVLSANDSLLQRIEKLENEREQERKYNSDKSQWHIDKENYILKKWDELPKRKMYFFSFVISTLLIIGLMIGLFIKFKTDDVLKLLLPMVTLVGGTIGLSFFNREKIANSCNYNFRTENFRKKRVAEFEKEFIKAKKEPEITDYIKP